MTHPHEELLRAAYTAHGADAPDSPHPVPEALADAVEQRGPEADRLRTLDHVGTCARCRREFELLRSTRIAARQVVASRRSLRAVGLAAAAVLLVGVTLTLTRSAGPHIGEAPMSPPASLPSERGGPTTETQQLSLITPLGPVDPAMARFIWHALRKGTTYHVEVLDDSGAVVARANTTDTVFTAPAHTLAPGRVYRWWVQSTFEGEPQHSSVGDFRTTKD